MTENESKTVTETERPSFPNLMIQNVYQAIKMNRKAKYSQLEDNLGVSESTILRAIRVAGTGLTQAWVKATCPCDSSINGKADTIAMYFDLKNVAE